MSITSEQPKVVLVKIVNVYGAQKIYPANEAAQYFAAIAGTKTLSGAVITYAAKLGFEIKQVEACELAGVAA